MSQPIPGLHIVRYGIAADQKYLLGDFLGAYDQLVINASMVAHQRSALASFITQKAQNKPYFIDPQTHAFQHDISYLESTSEASAGEIKRSFKNLLEAYGEPVKSHVQNQRVPVLPEHFVEPVARTGFCKRVLEFQMNAIAQEAETSDSAKYYKYLKEKGRGGVDSFPPSIAVAPYFYMTANTLDDWLEVNVGCARSSRSLASKLGVPLGVQVVISRDVLIRDTLLARLLEAYQSAEPEVFLVWVDAFSDQDASRDELFAFIRLLRGLAEKAPVVNLYGGFFSVALARCSVVNRLVGVAHGLEYGEDRGVLPVGGGVPVAKFYTPALHARLAFRDAFRAVRALGGLQSPARFHSRVCGCKECRSVIVDDPQADFAEYGRTRPISFMRRDQPIVREYPLPETKDHSVRHYMWCKAEEYRPEATAKDILASLEDAQKTLGTALGLDRVVHCRIWRSILSESSPKT